MKPKHALLLAAAIILLTDALLDPSGGTSVLDDVRSEAERVADDR